MKCTSLNKINNHIYPHQQALLINGYHNTDFAKKESATSLMEDVLITSQIKLVMFNNVAGL